MNWNDLKYFVELVDAKTLTATAEKLSVQHTTVARRVDELETALKIKLFDRMGKRYSLTEEGKLIYAQATEVASNIDTLKRMATNQHEMQGKVVISAPPVLVNEILTPQLSAFYKKFPDINLTVQGEVHHSNLYQREADIALRIGRPTQDGLAIRKLTEINYRFYAHSDYYRKISDKSHVIQLVELNINHDLLEWTNHVKTIIHNNVVFTTNDLYMARDAILQGVGMGALPEFLGKRDDLFSINLKAIKKTKSSFDMFSDKSSGQFRQNEFITAELYLVMHPDVRRSARVRAVADYLIDCF